MTETYTEFQLIGLRQSPYTLKVQSFFEFKGIPYKWVTRSLKNEPLFQKHAKVQLIPVVLFPSGEAMQDSTLILERLEQEIEGPSIHPEDPALWYLSCLFEEFGDEWCNKLMFFQRWFYRADAEQTGKRLAEQRLEGKWWGGLAKSIAAKLLVKRMVPRLEYSGGNENNIPQLKQSFEELSKLLDTHFESRPYLLGDRPCFGDFGLWCNLYQAWTDPTAHAYLEANAPRLVAYIKRMEKPAVEGDFETVDSLMPTLFPILKQEVAGRFLPWMDANHKAYHQGEEQTSLQMNGTLFQQKTFKYQANTLDELRRKFETVASDKTLQTVLSETDCLEFLTSE